MSFIFCVLMRRGMAKPVVSRDANNNREYQGILFEVRELIKVFRIKHTNKY